MTVVREGHRPNLVMSLTCDEIQLVKVNDMYSMYLNCGVGGGTYKSLLKIQAKSLKILAKFLKIWVKMVPNIVCLQKRVPYVCRKTHEDLFLEVAAKKVFMIFV